MLSGRTAAWIGAVLVLLSLGTASAQFFAIAYHPAHQYHGLLQSVAHGHETALVDLVFSALAAPPSPVEVHEHIESDANKTAHLYITVLQRQRCAEPAAVALSAVNISVLEDELTVRANTQHGAFTRTYKLPEHALPDQITAAYSSDKVLHVACPTDVPPPPVPLHIDVAIEHPEPPVTAQATPKAPAHSGDNEWAAYNQGASSQAASGSHGHAAAHAQTPAAKTTTNASAADTELRAQSASPRLDLERHIQKLEADLAHLKSMM
jgi:hypothetical protein